MSIIPRISGSAGGTALMLVSGIAKPDRVVGEHLWGEEIEEVCFALSHYSGFAAC